MDARRLLIAILVGLAVTGGGLLALEAGLFGDDRYDRTTVTVYDEDGTRLAVVEVRVADTFQKRYTGLSDTDSLDENEGMLFVHDGEARRSYVMRDMAFPLDIVFIAGNGTITEIHHATVPSEGTSESELTPYRGYGKYVLEVRLGYTNETGIEEGDRVEIAAN